MGNEACSPRDSSRYWTMFLYVAAILGSQYIFIILFVFRVYLLEQKVSFPFGNLLK